VVSGLYGIHDFALFVAAGLMLNLTPGPDALYVVGRSVTQGRLAGAAAALGIGTGTLVHIAAVTLGISALLAASAVAFGVVKLAGAGYLVYVGWTLLRESARSTRLPHVPPAPARASLRTIYLQGCLTNVLNPKVALFFLAFLPQFVTMEVPHHSLGLLLLGITFNVTGTAWNLCLALLAARLGRGLVRRARVVRWASACVGAAFVGLGIRLALTES
jgi:threonine/homoserine/homoserine lactone efflux protein